MKMGKKKDLTQDEKKKIVSRLAEGRKSLEIAKELSRDHRTIKRFVTNVNQVRKRTEKVQGENCQDVKYLPLSERLLNTLS